MSEIYTFNGKDITMNVFIQIRAVVDIIKEAKKIDFIEALGQFYRSNTYKTLQNTENGLWAESPEYIADSFFENRY
ncbi:MAG: hypothetical protein LUE92_02515 [Clostridiales bacterium]|nr:hypothetical protein [Clostridiales bacterium]